MKQFLGVPISWISGDLVAFGSLMGSRNVVILLFIFFLIVNVGATLELSASWAKAQLTSGFSCNIVSEVQ